MIKIINKTRSILRIGDLQLQQGINYITKQKYNTFNDNGLIKKLVKAVEDGKIEIQD